MTYLASSTVGSNRVYGSSGNDEIFLSSYSRGFAGNGSDIIDPTIDPTVGSGNNRVYGEAGNDNFFLGSSDCPFGNVGANRFFFTNDEGDNLITGGTDTNQCWIVNTALALTNTPNIISDYEPG